MTAAYSILLKGALTVVDFLTSLMNEEDYLDFCYCQQIT